MIRVGIVGCGSIAGTHAWAVNRIEGAKVTAVADCISTRAESLKKEKLSEETAVYASLDEMLDKEELDVLHICTPHWLHVPMAVEALKRGVSVFMEKPPAVSMEQFEQLRREAERSASRIGFCFQNRYNRTVLRTDAIVKSGAMGRIIGARAFVTWRRDAQYYDNEWKGRLSTEGGSALINQAIHTLDLMLRYLGEPVEVQAGMANRHLKGIIETEDTIEAFMSFENGERACFYASTAYAADAPVILELQFEKGSITVIDNQIILKENGLTPQIHTIEEPEGMGKSYWGSGHLSCIKDFYRALERKERFQNDLEGVRTTMQTMIRIYESAGRKV